MIRTMKPGDNRRDLWRTRLSRRQLLAVLAFCLALTSGVSIASAQNAVNKSDTTKGEGSAAEPTITLTTWSFRLDVGLDQRTFTVLVQGRNLSDPLMTAKLSAKDRALPQGSPTQVVFDNAGIVELTSGKNSRDWYVPFSVKGLPRNTQETALWNSRSEL